MDRASELMDEFFKKDPDIRRMLSPCLDELHGLDDAIRRVGHKHSLDPNNQDVTFEYATVLISHTRNSYVESGVRLMESLAFALWQRRWGGPTHAQLQQACKIEEPLQADGSGAPASPNLQQLVSSEEGREGQQMNGDVVSRNGKYGQRGCENPTRCSKDTLESDLVIFHYYLAVGWIKLKKYDNALSSLNRMLELKPGHPQGIALKQYVEAVSRQTITVAGLAGIAAISVAATVLMAFRRS
ncbi:hypothetical protein, conserved [Trypanosoma brucei gambiense DAL972]|uniref:Uncharacterized protein n=1 Tax=Trypanosoma brucei gambiense (strain MHOM/CI/86/DAL972) TaxID=679716 RepID=D0A3W2_TRYB9|nr:hypothetical protein, conserved [Trypanosoma brucei gambiense DAL972]CBH15956.1 hypothetical protein, conserved [Trypanosoma brucei gambiense DAL972]|eukprot:XP_011778220.1 hypothetical protein, conserved [Trypanosoma brucei gambiense DAL972]